MSKALALVALIAASGPASAVEPDANPVVQLDPDKVAAFVDAKVGPALASSGVPGMVVVVVDRDRVVFAKGYGIADVASGMQVDAERTLFDTASIGKSMAAIVTLQLVEEGRLDLDEDVNRYLKEVRVSGPKVTLRTLLRHRAGFDDDITGLFVPFDANTSMSVAELNRRLVPLVPPGHVTAYDNQGYGVVGLVLRDVTGQSLRELYRERIFEPAGMTGAVLGRPDDGFERLARCYTVQGPGAVQPCEYWLYREGLMGAGGVAASGGDLAHYMRLLLNRGTLDGREVLSPAAFATLIDFDHYRFHPGMPGGGFSFIQFEEFRGLEYAHSGSMPGFSSMMTLYQDAGVGIFTSFLGGQFGSYNLTFTGLLKGLQEIDVQPGARDGLNTLRGLSDAIAQEFVPQGRPRSSEGRIESPQGQKSDAVPGAEDSLDEFVGSYVLSTAHSRWYPARVFGWTNVVSVAREGADAIRFGGAQAALGSFRKIGPLLYENGEKQRVAFASLPIGRYMAIGLSGGVFRKTNALETPAWSLPCFVLGALLLLTALVQLRPRAPQRMRVLARGALLGFGVVLAGLLAEWQWGIRLALVEGSVVLPGIWRLALLGGAAWLTWSAVRFVRDPARLGPVVRAHGYLVALSGLAIVIALLAWRVLGAFPPQWTW